MPQVQKLATDDFITSAADHLRSGRFSRHQVEVAARREIEALREIAIDDNPHFGWRAENQGSAKRITKLLRKLRQEITEAPPGTQQALFAFGRYGPDLARPQDVDWQEVARYKVRFLFYLESMGRSCSIIERNPIGSYHTADPKKLHCANSALNLIVGLEAGEPSNSDENCALRIIAGFLFSAVHEGEQLDLRHQCEIVFASWKRLGELEQARHRREVRGLWGFQE